MPEENDTLASEASGEEDQDGARLEALPEFGGTGSLANLFKTYLLEFFSQNHFAQYAAFSLINSHFKKKKKKKKISVR